MDVLTDDLIIDVDKFELDDNDKQVRESPKRKDTQLKRWFVTLNNPFWNASLFEEVNAMETDLEIKYDYYNYDYIKNFSNVDLFEFHFIKVKAVVKEERIEQVLEKQIIDDKEQLVAIDVKKLVDVEKEFVVERPFFKDYDCLKMYIEGLEVEGLKYAVGQIERGKVTKTQHLQAGLIFDDTHGKRFYSMKKYLPCARLDRVRGSNYDLKVYCTKEDTREMEPFEIGKFSEMRARNDYEQFRLALKAGATNAELMDDFFNLVAQIGLRNIEAQRNAYVEAEFSKKCRNIEVTYIFGPGGLGKTKSVYKEFGAENIFKMVDYGQFGFHGYKHQKVLLMDEYSGQLTIPNINRLLDVYPLSVAVKGDTRVACYDKVFITSNIPYDKLYENVKTTDFLTYKAFDRRIHNIIEYDNEGFKHLKRETIFENVPEDEVELEGWTKRVSKRIEYDDYDLPHIVFDRCSGVQEEIQFLKDLENDIFGD